MPEELQPAKREVAGSSPVSAANYGRVAQRIERVKISSLFVARCATPYGRMPLGLHSFLATNPNDPNKTSRPTAVGGCPEENTLAFS